jgi:DNA mismatch repair protein MutL
LAPQHLSPDASPPGRTHPFAGGRFAGILFNTYILLELHEAGAHELVLIDQHAAHERIRYEKLRSRALQGAEAAGTQELLLPEAVKFPAEDRVRLEERLPWLERLGFGAEVFGEDTLLVRSVPSEWGSSELRPRLKALIERVLAAEAREGLLLDEQLFEKLASEACHSAIRAGDVLEPEEARALIAQLFESEHPWNCPHGRPTVVRVPEGRFEEWFQRRV